MNDLSYVNALFYIHSVLLLPFLIYYFYIYYKVVFSQRWPAIFIAVAFFGLIVGMLYDNSIRYVIGDTWKFLFVPLGIIVGSSVSRLYGVKYVVYSIFRLSTLLLVLKFLLFVYNEGSIYNIMYGGTYDVVPVLFLVSAVFAAKNEIKIKSILIMVLLAGIIFLGQKRTVIFIVVISPFVILLLRRFSFSILYKVFIYGAIVVVTGGLLFGSSAFDNTPRLASTDVSHSIGEGSKRLLEVVTVVNEVGKRDTIGFLFGLGSGATYEYPEPHGKYGYTETHTVHFTPGAMFFRYGLVGVLFLSSIILYVLFLLFSIRKTIFHGYMIEVAFLSMYLFFAILASFTIYGLIDDILFGIVLSLLQYIKKASSKGLLNNYFVYRFNGY